MLTWRLVRAAAARRWQHGYAPVDVPSEWDPPDAFHSMADKAAYWAGRLDLRTALPYTPATATVGDWTSLGADGLTLTAREEVEGCRQALPTEVYETDSVVVLIGPLSAPAPGRPCAATATSAPATFRLVRPLGTRDVLDAQSGQPLARTPLQPGGPIGAPSP